MVYRLVCNPEILKGALGLDDIWICCTEYKLYSEERIDVVFQDKWSADKVNPDTTCYLLELKSEMADHEVVGQIAKYIKAMEKKKIIGHWHDVKGLIVAKDYSSSVLELLFENGVRCFRWEEVENIIRLLEVKQKAQQMTLF